MNNKKKYVPCDVTVEEIKVEDVILVSSSEVVVEDPVIGEWDNIQ